VSTSTRAESLLTPRFVLIVVVGLLYFLSLGMLLPVVPVFVEDVLHGGSVAVGLAVGSFAVGAVLLRPLAGRIGDRSGRKVLIVGGALVVGLSAMLYHLAGSVAALMAVRVLGGIGEAAFFVGAGTMVTDLAPVERRGEAISYWSVAVYGGLAFGPFLGEVVLGTHEFARVWTVSGALALVAGVLAFGTRETMIASARAARERGTRAPLLHRKALLPGIVLFLGLVGLAGFFEFVPLYVEELDIDASRQVFLLYGCAVLAVRILGARIPDRIGPVNAATGATTLAATGLVLIALIPRPAGLYVGTVVFSLGMSLMYPAVLMLGAVILGGVAALSGYRGSFVGGAVFALAGLALLRVHIAPRMHGPVPRDVVDAALESLEPDPP
jgi:MFS family permease